MTASHVELNELLVSSVSFLFRFLSSCLVLTTCDVFLFIFTFSSLFLLDILLYLHVPRLVWTLAACPAETLRRRLRSEPLE